MSHTPPEPTAAPQAPGLWARLRSAHFHDYTPAALRMWLAIVAAGLLALAFALSGAFRPEAPSALEWLVGLGLVAAAAWFPIEIPRTKYAIGAADAYIFAILAVLGAPAAVVAAGLEGAIGTLRSTPRWTSRISTPAANMAAMALGGALFELAWPALVTLGWSPPLAKLALLPLVAVVPFTLVPLALISTVTLKRGHWPNVIEWFSSSSWMGALYVASALLAGVVQLGAIGQGSVAVAIIGVGTLAVVWMLSRATSRVEAEHVQQELRIREAELEAELNHQRFVAAFENAAVGMAIADADGVIVRANPAFCRLLGADEKTLPGRHFAELIHIDDLVDFEAQATAWANRAAGEESAIELRCCAAQHTRWVQLHGARFDHPDSPRDGTIYQLLDVTSRREAEQRLHHIAYHDSLTDLANRASFHERVSAAVEASRAAPHAQFAVMFMDLDRFKVVNDSLGHLAGNELLRLVGQKLSQRLGPKDLLARLGGDEFAVLLADMQDKAECVCRAEALLAELVSPMQVRGHEILAQASAGITFSDLGYRTVEELLRDADLAMYEAKAAGRGRVAVYDRSMHERMSDKLALEADLRRAIGEGELSLAFQPLYQLSPMRLIGFEALARWVHPTRGFVSPAVFIALAEEAGHIEALTTWALNAALAQLAAWHQVNPTLAHLGVNVNISGHDMARPRFVESVLDALRRHQVAPHQLSLELTETVLMSRVDEALAALERLRATGIRLAIDDFGTGYSSLAYLARLPIDCLKIDRSFVQGLDTGDEGLEIIRAIISLARALGKKVVAEGIETDAQLAALTHLGIDVGQGYLLAHPLAAEQVQALLSGTVPQPAA